MLKNSDSNSNSRFCTRRFDFYVCFVLVLVVFLHAFFNFRFPFSPSLLCSLLLCFVLNFLIARLCSVINYLLFPRNENLTVEFKRIYFFALRSRRWKRRQKFTWPEESTCVISVFVFSFFLEFSTMTKNTWL